MNDTSAPVAARKEFDPAAIQQDANLKVQVGAPTKRFHLWVQGPAWLLGFAAIALGFLMVLRGYDSAAGWFAAPQTFPPSVIASFGAPSSLGETRVSSPPGRRPAKPKTNPPTEQP